MADDQFHEFHLDGKQMVFLFMASTVVAVVIFLCGVMVGRGVRATKGVDAAAATVGATFDPTAPPATDTPPPDLTSPDGAPLVPVDDLTYPERLDGPVPPAESLREPARTARAAAVVPPRPRDVVGAAAAATSRGDDTAGAGKGLAVQVMSVTKRTEADAAARNLVSKGYPAFVSATTRGEARYRVRVGKYPTLEQAEAVKRQLQSVEKFRDAWIAR